MNWSLRQLKGLLIGTDHGSTKLHTQKLVLVENVKVRAKHTPLDLLILSE